MALQNLKTLLLFITQEVIQIYANIPVSLFLFDREYVYMFKSLTDDSEKWINK